MTDRPDIEARGMALRGQANNLQVTTGEEYVQAAEILKAIKGYRAQVADAFDFVIEQAHRTHQAALAQKKRYETPAIEAETIVKDRMRAFDMEAERQSRMEQARLRAEAEKRAEEERSKRALEALAAGNAKAAAVELTTPPVVAPVYVPKATPKVDGISTRSEWRYRIVDDAAVPRAYLVLDLKKIAAEVRIKKGGTNIPGIEAFEEKTVSAGAGR